MSEIESLIADFKLHRWESDPMMRAMRIAESSPREAMDLSLRLIEEVPEGTTFQDAVLSFVPIEGWPELVECAIGAFSKDSKNHAAEAVFQYGSMQCVQALHSHLDFIFENEPNGRAYYANWPWRDAGAETGARLIERISNRSASPKSRRKAWMCLLETRFQPNMTKAIELAETIDLNLQMREFQLPATLTLSDYLHLVGFELRDVELHRLYSNDVRHLVLGEEYFGEDKKPWQSNHPTWKRSTPDDEIALLGGVGGSACTSCDGQLHRLIAFSSTACLKQVTGIERLTLETCLSCLGWEHPQMFFRHDAAGHPKALPLPKRNPEFPASGFEASTVHLVEQGERWQWQSWGSSNSRENLHRVGGHPTWIQSAEYPRCPDCQVTMSFLMQLDTDLHSIDGGCWMWGSGGILYVFWCDACKISGMHWQCT